MALLRSALLACCVAATSLSTAPVASAATTSQADAPAELRRELVFTVDPLGTGDFVDLPTAIAAVPGRSLLLLKPGQYSGAVLDGKSLRIESEVPQAAQIAGHLTVQNIGPGQDVYLSGLFFEETFELRLCEGEVSLFGCGNKSGLADLPAGWNYCSSPCVASQCGGDTDCGCRNSRHRIQSCAAVSLVDCELSGRNGFGTSIDGASGEHAIGVTSSTVSIYGGSVRGGDGGEGFMNFHSYAGSGGDGVRAVGPLTLVRSADSVLQGGAAGPHFAHPGCPGNPLTAANGAQYIPGPADAVSFVLPPLARPGTAAGYVIGAPSGATILLKIGTRRGWREFPASTGVLHIQPPFRTIPLRTMGPSGVMSGSLPPLRPQWSGGVVGLELQVHAIFSGQDRFSEPRTLHVTSR